MNNLKPIIKSLFLFLLISCNNFPKYEYFQGFTRYLQNIYNLDSNKIENTIFFPINLQGCESCIDLCFDLLLKRNLNKNITPIFVGNNEYYINEIKQVKNKYNFLSDKMQKIYSYQTDFAYPMLVHIKNGECKIRLEINQKNYFKVLEYLKLNKYIITNR